MGNLHTKGELDSGRKVDMILVLGAVVARPDAIEEALRHSLEHVRRSRAEPGCLSHAVHRDAENPLRLVFVERWESREALVTHFAVPASNEFVRAVRRLSSEPPTIEIYDAAPTRV
jgi:quinol monooxygenase YgiN